MTVTIQELQSALRQHMDAGLEAEEAVRRLAVQFPDAKSSNAQAAAAALADEYDHIHAEAESRRCPLPVPELSDLPPIRGHPVPAAGLVHEISGRRHWWL